MCEEFLLFRTDPLSVITEQIQILFFIILITIAIFRWLKTLKTSGLIGMILLNYGAWTLGNFYWFLPLFLAQIMYHLLILSFVHYQGKEKVTGFQVKVLLYTGILPILLIFIANTILNYNLIYLPYLVSITGQIAIISDFFFVRSRLTRWFLCPVASTIFVAVLPILLSPNGVISIFIVGLGTLLAYLTDFLLKKYYHDPGEGDEIIEHRIRFLSVWIAVVVVFTGQIVRWWK